jgi:hypothetical protein
MNRQHPKTLIGKSEFYGLDHRQHFTMNPATPHPDSEGDPAPMPLDEAIAFALRMLKDPTATQWQRQKAADELQYSFDTQEPAA